MPRHKPGIAIALLVAAACGSDAGSSDTSRTDTAALTGSESPGGRDSVFSGSMERYEGRGSSDSVVLHTAARAARHPGFDRVVFEFRGGLPNYRVEYEAGRPVQCGSGDPIPLAGTEALAAHFEPANAHEFNGEQARSTIQPRERTPGFTAVREMKLTCDFEAVVEWAIGVDQRRPFRVLTLDSPPRLVIDIGLSADQATAARVTPTRPGYRGLIDVTASGFPASSPINIGLGPPQSEYQVIASSRTDAAGSLTLSVKLPDWARAGRPYVVVVTTPENRPRVNAGTIRIQR